MENGGVVVGLACRYDRRDSWPWIGPNRSAIFSGIIAESAFEKSPSKRLVK